MENIERNGREKQADGGHVLVFCRLVLLFFAISFLGWLTETVYCFFVTGQYCDRGFLTMPFCTIYGCSILGVYAMVGTPRRGGLLLGRVRRSGVRLALYPIVSALIPTMAELLTGFFFHRFFGLRLWDYSTRPLNIGGYVCLPFSVIWGILITVFMSFLFPPLKRWICRLPRIPSILLAAGLGVAFLLDFTLKWFLI